MLYRTEKLRCLEIFRWPSVKVALLLLSLGVALTLLCLKLSSNSFVLMNFNRTAPLVQEEKNNATSNSL